MPRLADTAEPTTVWDPTGEEVERGKEDMAAPHHKNKLKPNYHPHLSHFVASNVGRTA